MRIFPKVGVALIAATALLCTGFLSPANALPDPTGPVAPSMKLDRADIELAQIQLAGMAGELGIETSGFTPVAVVPGFDGIKTIRFEQNFSGIPVLGSFVSVTISKSNSVLSSVASTAEVTISPKSNMSKVVAAAATRKSIAQLKGVSESLVSVSNPTLVVMDGALIGDPSISQQLAWRSRTIINDNVKTLSDTFISDDTGDVISNHAWIRTIETPYVCDMNTATTPYDDVPGVLVYENIRYMDVRSNSVTRFPLCGPTTSGVGEGETLVASANITQTQNFFLNYLGIDIGKEAYLGNISPALNGDETPRISAFVNACAQTSNTGINCPFENAFWVPWSTPAATTPDVEECRSTVCSGIYFGNMRGGNGLDVADDVVAHELSHGVTFSLAFYMGLQEKTETAALSEAISDIFGEATDQMTVAPGELADPNWNLGEDVVSGGFRSMKTPDSGYRLIRAPWRISDSHQSSGPINRLSWLLANGGKVGSVTIKPLGTVPADGLCQTSDECTGITRMTALTLATVSKLSPSSNFFDYGRAMIQACQDFVKNKTAGFSSAACKNVALALQAQGITQFQITKLKNLKSVKHGKPATVSAVVTSLSGSTVIGQTMNFQVWKKGKWVTVATPKPVKTNSQGKVAFKFVWAKPKKSLKYRIVTNTNGGLIKAVVKHHSVKVR